MSNITNLSGSDKLGIADFYKETNRYSAREFEERLGLSFIDTLNFEIKSELAHYHESCPICDHKSSNSLFKKDGYHHVKCKSCDLIYVNPCLKQDVINTNVFGTTPYPFFESVNSESQQSFDRLRFEGVIRSIKDRFPEKKSIYDIGCGSGFFLKLCKENGFEEIGGIDALKKAQVYAEKTYKIENVKYGDYRSLSDEKKKYDIVSLWEILDHVVEPKDLLRIAESMLNPKGLLIISVRNGFSLAARILRDKCNMFLGYAHTNFWNIKTFDYVGKEYNLNLVEMSTYISELGAINNFLNYQDPYSGKTDTIDFLPSQDEVNEKLQGYKFIVIMQKINS
jgi:2-polyprenyl-3-methyl-5-hydroxy-6-metoxy-1,4-benzoquinol methylase